MQTKEKPVVLVSPLDWGMGHATRCIPIIEQLLSLGAEVILFASENVLLRLSSHFPELEKIPSYSHDVNYSRSYLAWLSILFQLNRIKSEESKSYAQLQRIIKNRQIDLIISDNRYFVRDESIKSIIICHQLNPVSPIAILQPLIRKISAKLLNQFDEIYLPDVINSKSLSGSLSSNSQILKPVVKMGLLSRFSTDFNDKSKSGHLLIASGPEPQLSMIIDLFIKVYSASVIELTIITPNTTHKDFCDVKNIRILVNPNDETFKNTVISSEFIICRGGYSSIMDLLSLNRRALLVPTPGQTEQEYLSKHLEGFGFSRITQKQLSNINNPNHLPRPKEKDNSFDQSNLSSYRETISETLKNLNRSE